MKTFKKAISIVLAALMVMGSLSAFATLNDGLKRTLTSQVRFYREDANGDWVETTKVTAGDKIEARIIFQSDFIVGSHSLYYLYSKDVFSIDTSRQTSHTIASYDSEQRGGDIYWDDDNTALNNSMINKGYLDASVFDDYNSIYIMGYIGYSSIFDGIQEIYTIYFTVNEDVTDDMVGTMFIPVETRRVTSGTDPQSTSHIVYAARAKAEDDIGVDVGALDMQNPQDWDADFEVYNLPSTNINTVATAQGDDAEIIAANIVAPYNTGSYYGNESTTTTSSYVTLGGDVDVTFAVDGDDDFSEEKQIPFGDAIADYTPDYEAPFGYNFAGWPKNNDGTVVDDKGNAQATELVDGQTVTGSLEPVDVTVEYAIPYNFGAYDVGEEDLTDVTWSIGANRIKRANKDLEISYGEDFSPDYDTWGNLTFDDTIYYLKGWTPVTEDDMDQGFAPTSATPVISDYSALTTDVVAQNYFVDNGDGTYTVYLAPVILEIPTVSYTITYYELDGTTEIEVIPDLLEGDDIEVTGTEPEEIEGKVFADEWTYYNADTDEEYTGDTMPAFNLYAIPVYLDVYTITYNANEGEGTVANGTKTQGVDYTIASGDALTREGYTFSGWNTAADGTGTAYAAGATYTEDANLDLYAQWTLNTYTVTYDANEGEGTVADGTKNYGEAYTIASGDALTREGYTFSGWNTAADGTGTTYAAGAAYTENADVTLYAQWTLNTYTITYNANEGEGTMDNGTKNYGEAYTIEANGFTYAYHTFNGWNTEPDGTGTAYAAGAAYTENADVTLYAQWTADTYTVTFTLGRGKDAGATWADGTTENIVVGGEVGEAITAPEGMEWPGHTFAEWDAEVPATMPEGNVTINALWNDNTYTITFTLGEDNDGATWADGTTADIVKADYSYGDTVETPAEDPIWEGYEFAGWAPAVGTVDSDKTYEATFNYIGYSITYYELDGTTEIEVLDGINEGDDLEVTGSEPAEIDGKVFADEWTYYVVKTGEKYTEDTMPAANLYAIPVYLDVYTITYDANGGEGTVADGTKTEGVDYTVASGDALAKEGYTFDGWNTAADGTGTAYAAGDAYTADEATTLYAQWKANDYTIKFVVDGEEVADLAITAAYESDITAPADPTKDGYTFDGWYSDAEYTTEANVPATMPLDGATFYGKFDANDYTIRFVVDGEEVAELAITAAYESDVTAPADPEKEGYSFDGWYSDAEYTTAADVPATMPLDGATFYGKFDANEYTITLKVEGGDDITITQDYGTDITAPDDPTKEGYTFDGWYSDEECTQAADIPATMPLDGGTFYGKLVPNDYTIKFVVDGEEVADLAITAAYESDITAPADPVKDGYTFHGWYSDAEYTTAADVPATMPLDGGTFYGYFTLDEAEYTVEIYYADTTNTYADTPDETKTEAGTIGETVTYDPEDVTGFELDTGYADYLASDTLAETGTVLKIFYKRVETTITFSLGEGKENGATWDDGTTEDKTVTGLYGAEVPAEDIPSAVWEGHDFAGWSTTIPATFPADDITVDSISALWDASAANYTVIIMLQNADGDYEQAAEISLTGTAGETVTVAHNDNMSGYTFSDTDTAGRDTGVVAADGSSVFYVYYARNEWTIKFIVDGEEVSSESKLQGASITEPEIDVATGEEFDGWYSDAEFTTEATVPSVMPDNDLTFYGQKVQSEYTLTFKVIKADGTEEIVSETVQHYGDPIVAPAYTAEEVPGQEFITWTVEDGDTMPAEDTEYVAFYITNIYTLTYYVDGEVYEEQYYAYGDDVELLDESDVPAKVGNTFRYWTDDSGAKVTMDTMPAEDISLYALYSPYNYALTYYIKDTDGNISLADKYPKLYGSEIALDFTEGTGETYEGYTIDGPYTNATYTTAYTETTMPAKAVDLYYQLVPVTYTATFDAGEGAFEDGDTTKEVEVLNGNTPQAPSDPVREGYEFTGWSPAVGTVTGDTTYTATWTEAVYTITYQDEDGTVIDEFEVEFGAEVETTADPEKDGYTFTGWEDEDGKAPEDYDSMPANDLVFPAVYEAIEYTIKFVVDGEEVADLAITAAYESDVTAPADPEKEGYTFDGWYSNEECTTAAEVPATMPLDGATFYGKFDANEYTITFIVDGEEYEVITEAYGADLTAPVPTKDNSTFDGWYSDEECTTAADVPATIPAEDLTFYGKFTADTYKVTYIVNGEVYFAQDGIEVGAAVPTPDADPVVDGYNFLGWDPTVPDEMPAEDLTFTARLVETQAVVKLVPKDESSTAMVERDGVVETYNEIDENYMPAGVTEIVEPFSDTYGEYSSTTYDKWYVTGLKTALKPEALDDYVTVTGNGYYELDNIDDNGRLGTGTVIKVYTEDGVLVEQFYIVIYGDLDGNGRINDADVTEAEDEINNGRTWSSSADRVPYIVKASDLDQNGRYNDGDTTLFEQYINKTNPNRYIDQITGYYKVS